MTFGEYLIELRESRGLSQRQFAKAASVTNSTISRLENNQVVPDLQTIDKLSKAALVDRMEMVERYYESLT